MISRRGLVRSLLAAPVIIRTPGLLMPIRPMRGADGYGVYDDYDIGSTSIPLTWTPSIDTTPMTYQIQWSVNGGRTWNDIGLGPDRWPSSPNGFIDIRLRSH